MMTEFAKKPRPDSGWSHLPTNNSGRVFSIKEEKISSAYSYLCAGWRIPKLLARSALRSAIRGRGKEDNVAEPRTLKLNTVVMTMVVMIVVVIIITVTLMINGDIGEGGQGG